MGVLAASQVSVPSFVTHPDRPLSHLQIYLSHHFDIFSRIGGISWNRTLSCNGFSFSEF